MRKESGHLRAQQWARLRFAVVGPLLASPPARGELRAEIERLAQRLWQHPLTGAPLTLGFSTIERWLAKARAAQRDPMAALRQQVRKDAGAQPSLNPALCTLIGSQYHEHPSWTVKLHVDNLAVRVAADAALGPMPSYQTVRRCQRSPESAVF
jgi:putative transposase